MRIGWSLLALTCASHVAAATLSLVREPAYETVLYALVNILMAGAGVGITSMRERAIVLGGSFSISRDNGRGTRVHVTLPVAG